MSAGSLEIFISHYDENNNKRVRTFTVKSIDYEDSSYIIHHVDDTIEKLLRDSVTRFEIHATRGWL